MRIFHALPRFSEDLDFSLLAPEDGFSLAPYFKALEEEFAAFGFQVTISQRQKKVHSAVVSAFLKENTSVYDVRVASDPVLKIKFEVDTQPPAGFATENRLLLQPYSFHVRCYTLPDLFAGKMHAVLFRRWRNRVKGRDWFDFEWYVRHGHQLNLAHLTIRARQSGDWGENDMSEADFSDLLRQRIDTLDVGQAKREVLPFVSDAEVLAIWSRDYFQALARRLIVT